MNITAKFFETFTKEFCFRFAFANFHSDFKSRGKMYEFDFEKDKKHLESPGIDPGASRMLSERSTI